MAKYKVLLHGRDVLMPNVETGQTTPGGFYVTCCVEAPDAGSAADTALAEVRRHPKYLVLASWPAQHGPPLIEVDSVDRLPFWRRRLPLGIPTGFVFYSEQRDGEQPTEA